MSSELLATPTPEVETTEFTYPNGRTVLVTRLPYEKGANTRQYITYGTDTNNPFVQVGDVSQANNLNRPAFKRFIPDTVRTTPQGNGSLLIDIDGTQRTASKATIYPYSEAASGLDFKCIDLLVVDPNTGELLIGQRDQEPQPGDWIIGGRKQAGTTDFESAQKNAKRELGVDLQQSDVLPLGMSYDMMWDTREQMPTTNEKGQKVTSCHEVSVPFVVPVDKGVLEAKHNEEYSHLRWVKLEDIIDAEPGTYHPTLVDMAYDTLERITRPEEIDPSNHAALAERAMLAMAHQKTYHN